MEPSPSDPSLSDARDFVHVLSWIHKHPISCDDKMYVLLDNFAKLTTQSKFRQFLVAEIEEDVLLRLVSNISTFVGKFEKQVG